MFTSLGSDQNEVKHNSSVLAAKKKKKKVCAIKRYVMMIGSLVEQGKYVGVSAAA